MRSPITLQGAEKLRAELRRLKAEDRPAVIRAIAEARSHGDLSENAEYHAAREQQGFIEGRISEIEDRLGRAEVIDPAKLAAGGKVVFGATVDLEVEDGEARGELQGDVGMVLAEAREARDQPAHRKRRTRADEQCRRRAALQPIRRGRDTLERCRQLAEIDRAALGQL